MWQSSQSEQSKLLLNFYRKLPLWSNIFKCHNFKNYKFLSTFIYQRLSFAFLLSNVKNTLHELAELCVTLLIMAITLNWQVDIIQSSSTFISLQSHCWFTFIQLFVGGNLSINLLVLKSGWSVIQFKVNMCLFKWEWNSERFFGAGNYSMEWVVHTRLY